ncbi:MAG TPA: hypothetical protein VFZ28_09560 [Burkholderiaceae bacterium]|nr:hypothetical protein [Burkholderiaceae bacterium]
MTRSFTTQAVSLALSALVTLCTLLALDGLAGIEHAAQAQQLAAATQTKA